MKVMSSFLGYELSMKTVKERKADADPHENWWQKRRRELAERLADIQLIQAYLKLLMPVGFYDRVFPEYQMATLSKAFPANRTITLTRIIGTAGVCIILLLAEAIFYASGVLSHVKSGDTVGAGVLIGLILLSVVFVAFCAWKSERPRLICPTRMGQRKADKLYIEASGELHTLNLAIAEVKPAYEKFARWEKILPDQCGLKLEFKVVGPYQWRAVLFSIENRKLFHPEFDLTMEGYNLFVWMLMSFDFMHNIDPDEIAAFEEKMLGSQENS